VFYRLFVASFNESFFRVGKNVPDAVAIELHACLFAQIASFSPSTTTFVINCGARVQSTDCFCFVGRKLG
jgi:hypothetical protein